MGCLTRFPGYQINIAWYLGTGLIGVSLHLVGHQFSSSLFSIVHPARGQEIGLTQSPYNHSKENPGYSGRHFPNNEKNIKLSSADF